MKQFGYSDRSRNILRNLMDNSGSDDIIWSSDELRSILNHQLTAELAGECSRIAEAARTSVAKAKRAIESCGCATFGELLSGRADAIEVLLMVKEYAKASLTGNNDIPRNVARVLYMMAIVCGLKQGANGITSMNKASIDRELRRCLTFTWLPTAVREILRSYADTNGSSPRNRQTR